MGSWPCGLSQQQVEQHGAHDRGDHREQDHQQTARPTTQRADLHSSGSHGLAPSAPDGPTDHLWPCPVVDDRRTSDYSTGWWHGQAVAPLAPRPCHAASRRLGPGAPAGLGAEVLGVLGNALGEVLAVLPGLLLGGAGGAAGYLLGDLLAPVQGFLAGLLDLVLHLIGHRPQPLVLDSRAGDGQAGQEAERDRADGQPERVLLGQPSRPLGLLLEMATAGGGLADPGGRVADRIAGPGRGADHGLLGSGGGVAHLRLHVLHLVAHCVLGSGGHVGLVADGLDGLAHLGPGLLYVLSDRIWVLAHSTSSFTVSMVCSGTGGPAAFIFAWPCLTRTKAMMA